MIDQSTLTLILEVLIGAVLLGVILILFSIKLNLESKADNILIDMTEAIRNIILDEAVSCAHNIAHDKIKTKEEFEKYVLESSSRAIWLSVSTSLNKAVEEGLINETIRNFITKDYVDRFIDTIIAKNMCFELESIYAQNMINSSYDSMINKDKELEEKFSNSEDYYTEDIDNKVLTECEDMKDVTTKLIGDNDVEDVTEKEIIPPSEEITESNTVTEEVSTENNLTEDEIAAGIHFNKSGRKVDSKGRFVKS